MNDPRYEDWKRRANEVDMLATAIKYGAKLKRAGREHIGPCPVHAGRDRFSVNPQRGAWNCRGDKGGHDTVSLLMHVASLSFSQACQELTGEPPPSGQARPLSAEDQERIERGRRESERKQREREAQQQRDREMNAAEAREFWERQVKSIDGTLAERYLIEVRKIPKPPSGWPATIGFGLVGYGRNPWADKFPCLVGRIQDVADETVAIHAVFLDSKTANKINRDPSKLTFGPAQGGAVRLGGVGPRVDTCEGLESGLGILWITAFKHPVWACVGTAGLSGVELPLEVKRVSVWPDGDKAVKRQGDIYVPTKCGAGIKAARDLRDRCKAIGVAVSLNTPPADGDYLNAWNALQSLGCE